MVFTKVCFQMGISPFPLISRLSPSKQEAWGMNVNNYHPTSLTNLSSYKPFQYVPSILTKVLWQGNKFFLNTHHLPVHTSSSKLQQHLTDHCYFSQTAQTEPKGQSSTSTPALPSLATYMNKLSQNLQKWTRMESARSHFLLPTSNPHHNQHK